MMDLENWRLSWGLTEYIERRDCEESLHSVVLNEREGLPGLTCISLARRQGKQGDIRTIDLAKDPSSKASSMTLLHLSYLC